MNLRSNVFGTASAVVTMTVLGLASVALAGPFNPPESLGTNYYALTFGTQGSGTDSLSGTGVENHGAFAFPPGNNLRFFDGESGGLQAFGVYDIAYKNLCCPGGSTERISDWLPNRVPAVGSGLSGGGSFDGTALWLGYARFQAGLAPAIGTDSPPTTGTRWNSSTGAAETGTDVRPESSHYVDVPIVLNVVTQMIFLMSAQVYVPSHNADQDGANAINYSLRPQPYVDRNSFGLTTPGGHGGHQINFSGGLDQWSLLQIRAHFITDGGSLASSSDDSARVTYSYFLNGTQVGGAQTFILDPTWITSQPGPIHFGPGYGLTRGWQGDAPEMFFDDISVFEIVPEPTAALLLLAGGLLLWRRR